MIREKLNERQSPTTASQTGDGSTVAEGSVRSTSYSYRSGSPSATVTSSTRSEGATPMASSDVVPTQGHITHAQDVGADAKVLPCQSGPASTLEWLESQPTAVHYLYFADSDK